MEIINYFPKIKEYISATPAQQKEKILEETKEVRAELNKKFINDVISRSSLSKMESIDAKTYYKGEPLKVFKIDRPKKTWGQKIKDFVY